VTIFLDSHSNVHPSVSSSGWLCRGGVEQGVEHRGDLDLWLDLRLDLPRRVERGVEHRGRNSPLVRLLVRPAKRPSRCVGDCGSNMHTGPALTCTSINWMCMRMDQFYPRLLWCSTESAHVIYVTKGTRGKRRASGIVLGLSFNCELIDFLL
jgi:hypothetical protein